MITDGSGSAPAVENPLEIPVEKSNITPERGILMAPSQTMTEQEWELIRELLERELAQISMETRHTRTGSFKSALRDRMDLITGILHRLERPVTA